jgi:formylglycine-generating enzyme required for sulfatase activity
VPTRNWYVNGQMQTMIVIRGPVEFLMGSPESEVGRRHWAEDRLLWRVERSFAIATTEVTRSQCETLLNDNPDVFRPDSVQLFDKLGKYMPEAERPVNVIKASATLIKEADQPRRRDRRRCHRARPAHSRLTCRSV